MTTSTETVRARVALLAAHCAGMIDLVALPVWVGALIEHYRFDPQRAGALATIFLLAVVGASVCVAPRLHRLRLRWVAAGGFGVAAAAFALCAAQGDWPLLALAHAVGGGAAGAALSVTHGTIARSANPHRLFALAGIALGVFAVLFLAVTPALVRHFGGSALFWTFAAVMAAAALVTAAAFPVSREQQGPQAVAVAHVAPAVWMGVAGVTCMAVVQAMTFAFLERAGVERGFKAEAVHAVLIALGLVNLLPAALAAWLERRWQARRVLLAGPIVQAALAMTIMNSTEFAFYAAAASVFSAVMIFTHTFAFGWLSRLEPSGRAMAATPAMLMVGAAVGPLLGGTLVQVSGFSAIGLAAAAIAAAAVLCFSRLPRAGALREGLVS